MAFNFKQFSVKDEHSSMKVGTDAVLLGAWAGDGMAKNILDIGTGSGLIALMMAQRNPDANILGVDIHRDSVEEAIKNFKASPWHNRLSASHVPLQQLSDSENKKYDSIISNPPFFTSSLLPQTQGRTMAKHTEKLSFTDLATHSARLLSPMGTLSMILPVDSHESFSKHAVANGLTLFRRTNIIPKTGKTPNRILSEWIMKEEEIKNENFLTIRNSDNTYTSEYIELSKEFYLAL